MKKVTLKLWKGEIEIKFTGSYIPEDTEINLMRNDLYLPDATFGMDLDALDAAALVYLMPDDKRKVDTIVGRWGAAFYSKGFQVLMEQ